MKFLDKYNFKKIAALSIATLIFSIINGYYIVPKIIIFMVKKNVQLRPGSQMRPLFERIPFPLIFKVHIFNMTNSDEFLQGKKPILSDVGPFVFEEWKERHDFAEDESNDTITYTMRNRFIFRPDMSNGLTGDEMLIVPNIILFGTISVIQKDRAPMLPFIVKALNAVFENPKTPFVKVKAIDFLFNGIGFNCGEDFSAKTLCAGFEAEATQVEVVNETYYRYSILGDKNRTDVGRFTIYRGIKNSEDLGRIVTFNDEIQQSTWEGDKCNEIKGTDSTIFPPFLTKDEGLWTFTPDVCMSLKSHFVRDSSFDGMPSRIYSADFGDLKNEPEKHCFCDDPPDSCPPKGTLDLFPCVKAPIFGSKPHFLDSDSSLLNDVIGLAPNRSLHDIFVNFEPISGTPFEGYKRLQFNFAVEPVEEMEILSKIPKLLLPVMWVEEGVKLNKTYTNLLKYQLFLGKKINSVTKWMGIVGGTVGMLLSLFMIFKKSTEKSSKKSSSTTTASVTPATDLKNIPVVATNKY